MARPTSATSMMFAAVLAIVAPAMTLVHTVGRLDTRPSLSRVWALGARTATTFIRQVPAGRTRSHGRCRPTWSRFEARPAERPTYRSPPPDEMNGSSDAGRQVSSQDRYALNRFLRDRRETPERDNG